MRVAGDAARGNATQALNTGGFVYANGYLPAGYQVATGTTQISGMPGVVPGGAAHDGGPFSEVAEAARAAVALLGARTSSLAEYRRGRLTATKRDLLQAVLGEAETLREQLEVTDPENKPDGNALTLEDEWALAEQGLNR
jgi:hypothetical protein